MLKASLLERGYNCGFDPSLQKSFVKGLFVCHCVLEHVLTVGCSFDLLLPSFSLSK